MTEAPSPRLQRLLEVLACPACRGALEYDGSALHCAPCGAAYPVRGERVYFVQPPAGGDELDSIKGRLKRWLGSAYYTLGVRVLAPTYPFNYAAEMRRWLNPARQVVVDLGSGNHRIDPNVFTADLFDYANVDVVCDLDALPFRADSVDAFMSRSVLEHVPNPYEVVAALHRCTRPGGLSLHLIPFLFPFHASPHDFHRFTSEGVKRLFGAWSLQDQRNATGPVTLWLLLTIETLATMLALGRERPKAYAYLLLCACLFPIKYLDAPFVRRTTMLPLAPTIFSVVRKPDEPAIA